MTVEGVSVLSLAVLLSLHLKCNHQLGCFAFARNDGWDYPPHIVAPIVHGTNSASP